MELYSKPIITTSDDGTISIKVQPITPEYIETRLAELAVFDQINYNIEEVVSTVQMHPPRNKRPKGFAQRLVLVQLRLTFYLT